jgi:hypothetical protein
LPGRKISFSDHSVMVADDVSADVVSAALFTMCL